MTLKLKQVFYRLKHVLSGMILLASIPLATEAQVLSDTTITIKVLGGLQFDTPRLILKPNTRVTLILDNHDDMAHNFVLTKPSSRLKVVEEAAKLAERGAKMNYVPTSPLVIASTKIVEPGNMETISFVLDKAGQYPYVCTYPGHGYVMFGVIYVGQSYIPPFEKDTNIPESQRSGTGNEHAHHGHGMPSSPHPYPIEFPMLYRTFMPEASPAAIAVALTPTESYCWDAGKCYLRYFWTGGFVDNAEQWKGNGSKLTKVEGEIYWREKQFPFTIGTKKSVPKVDFKGYKLKKRLPTFEYTLDGIKVAETLVWNESAQTITRVFVLGERTQTFYFNLPEQKSVSYTAKNGQLKNGVMAISKTVKTFSIIIKRN
ncbi:plastocyanin/azurin family copper-binding protein [Flectobacillus rivi]|uniref:Plastocyanin/azurin family copper-binding protein n=1 Tax=Flectobacillus rivi TaxID=2984209 RepID=A0ABT6Z668_9BACT|nr:plastocyanin/azurin family copper-binding protein [Flectobacillus rivi]MDI9876056.1 plastocyanin/azurin family copper-binding protein [Flectobacillus rivi]